MPAGQVVQTALPTVDLYDPAAHVEHGPPSGPVNPTLHLQSDTESAAICSVIDPAGHAIHCAVPADDLYVEYGQS